MQTLTHLLEEVPAGCNWLLRSDESGRYFCHITEPQFVAIAVPERERDQVRPHSFPAWGDSPEAAVSNALLEYHKRSGKVGRA